MYEEETYRKDDVWATYFVHHFCISYIRADFFTSGRKNC